MSKNYLNAALLALTAFLVAAPSIAQSPAIEPEGYDAQSAPRPTAQAMLPVRACISTTCRLPLPNRDEADDLARGGTRATFDEMDAISHPAGSPSPETPRWEPHR